MSELRDLQIQHALYLLRYANGVDRDIQKLLNDLEKKIVAKLGERLAGIEERGADLGPTVTKRLEQTLAEIRAVNGTVYGQAHDRLKGHLKELAGDEIEFGAKALSKATGVKAQVALASPQRLESIVTQRPIQGKLLASFFKGAEAANMDRVEQVIQLGMSDGNSVDEMAREVRKALGTSKSKSRAIVRTSVNAISNHAQMESFAKNPNVVKAWRFVATLDSRTSLVCASLSNRVFPVGKGPTPPRHPNCRSTIVAVTDLDELGIDPQQLERDGEGKVTRTPEDDDPSFEQWMKGKGEAFQDQILGKTRADLWRDGKYSLQDFVRNNDEVISLSDLRKTHPVADIVKEADIAAKVPKPKAAPKAFSPINPNTTAETIVVRSKAAISKELRPAIAAAHKTNRFQRNEFRGNENKLGKVSFSAAFDDNTVSMISAILPEIDAITDRFAVPRLRGLNSRSGAKASASMGDGVLSINADIFNGYAAGVGKAAPKFDITEARAKIDAIRKEYSAAIKAANDAIDAGDYGEYTAKQAIVNEIAKRFERTRKAYNASVKAESIKKSIAARPASTWKLGDDVAKRPHGAQDYFTGIDKARCVMYHETAHTVHQEKFRTGYRRDVGDPPIELELRDLYNAKAKAGKLFENLPTRYSGTNPKEWFAENFALYMMGRKDLCDEDLIELIERLMTND